MPEKLVVEQCAPTLAGIKTASLFNSAFDDARRLDEEISVLNRRLAKAGMRFIVLARHNGRALVYLVRFNRLKRDLASSETASLLKQMGYDPDRPEACLARLKARLAEEENGFPHEIGLFLGYPVEDVRGFMENRKCLFTGLWKVYSHPEKTKRTFAAYKRTTAEYERRHQAGSSLEELAGIKEKEGIS